MPVRWVRSSPLGTWIFPRPVIPNRPFSLASVWRRLTEPHPSIREAHRRRVITLVAAWNLGTIPLGPLLGALQVAAGESARTSVVWMLIAPLITVILYLLSRSRYAWHALHGQVASTVFLVGASMLVSPDRAATATALLVPVLVAALCFGMREVIVIQATAGLMLLAHAFSLPAGQRGILIGSASVLLAGFAITVALVRHRELLIQEREQEARADAERARALLGAGFDGTADIVDGRLVHVSDGFAGALGCKASDLEGRPVDHAFTILAGNGPALDEAVPFLDGEGSLRYLTVLRQVLPHESGVDEVIAIRDQTHTQLHKSNLLFTDRMVAVGTLASGVAHEINNALMTLSGHAELGPLALDKGDTERARGSFLAVQQGSDRIAACVRQLRRFGNGSGETSAPLSLNDVVTSTLQLARHRLRHVAVMDVELANDLPLCNVPEASVGQILMNLLLNALDAIEGVGEPRIRTTTARKGTGRRPRSGQRSRDLGITRSESSSPSSQEAQVQDSVCRSRRALPEDGRITDSSIQYGRGLPPVGCIDRTHTVPEKSRSELPTMSGSSSSTTRRRCSRPSSRCSPPRR